MSVSVILEVTSPDRMSWNAQPCPEICSLSQEMKIAHFKNHGLLMRTKVLLLENNVSM